MLVIALVIALAFFVESSIGFGGGLIAISLLSLFLPVTEAVPLIMVFQFMMGLVIFGCWREISWQNLKPFLLPMAVGTIIGSWLLDYIDDKALKLFIAVFICVYLVYAHFGQRFQNAVRKFANGVLMGGFGGFVMGLVGTGGPFYVVYFRERDACPFHMRANLIASFFITNVLRVPGYTVTGPLDKQTLAMALYALPLYLLAIWAGHKWHRKMPEKLFRLATEILLAGVALSIFLKLGTGL